MPDNEYPVFESGQTLTAVDLNQLRAFLHERDRLVGRMIGFGVNAGLGGSVSGTTLTIAPGLAIDQYGEPLVLPTAQTISLPPTPVTPSYDFIATGPGGFSVVLEATESVNPAPACGEADCAGHAEHHIRSASLRVVSGRVTGTIFDFPGDDLLKVKPVRVSLDSSPITSFDDLRTALVKRLKNEALPSLIRDDLINALDQVRVLAGDTPAVKGYKCGWINMVLFATLDLLRVESLLRLAVDRDPARAGVVVGWVHQVLNTWVFDCAYRHAWEPPRGFTEAFLGGSCTDPAGLYRDLVEQLISGYAPPDPPVQGNPPQPPVQCPAGWIRINGTCRPVWVPPVVDYPGILDEWVEFDPRGPVWIPPFEEPDWLRDPGDIYGQPPLDFYNDGVLGGWQYVGQPGDDVRGVLTTYIEGRGIEADIKVVSQADAEGLAGYLPTSAFSPSDTIVLSVNAAGNVIGTGRVAASFNSQQVSTALPAAQTAVAEAKDVAVELRGLSQGLRADFEGLNLEFTTLQTDFGNLKLDFNGYKGGAFDQSGFGVRINGLENQVKLVGEFNERMSKLEGKVEILDTRGLVGGGKVIDANVGKGISEFTETAVAAVQALGKRDANLERYVKDVERAHARFEVDVNTEDPRLIGASTLDVLKSMRTMVKSALKDSPEAAAIGSQLDAQIREIQLMVEL